MITPTDELIARIDELAVESQKLDWTGVEARGFFDAIVDYACGFLNAIEEAPACHEDADPALDGPLPEKPQPLAKVLDRYDRAVLGAGINPVSGRFFGYIPGGGIPSAAAGDLIAATTNRYAGVYLASPGAAAIENRVIAWLRDLIGLPASAWGTLQSGGTLATLTALVAARSTRPIERWPRSVIYSSPEAHVCLDKSIHISGLTAAVHHRVPVDDQHRLAVADLRARIAADRAAGLDPWIVAASAGTVNTGAIDPLAELADVCTAEELWLHADGAYGGFFVMTDRGRKRLAGIERADSVVLDPHKGLFQRYGCGAVLVRDGKRLKSAMSYHADYLADVADDAQRSPADYSPELTRHFRGLALWLSLEVHGAARFRAALEEKLLLARYLHRRLADQPGLQVGPQPQLSIVAFRLPSDDDEPTRQLLERILQRGHIHLSSTRLHDQLWLRACVLSFRSHRSHVEAAVDEVQNARRDLGL